MDHRDRARHSRIEKYENQSLKQERCGGSSMLRLFKRNWSSILFTGWYAQPMIYMRYYSGRAAHYQFHCLDRNMNKPQEQDRARTKKLNLALMGVCDAAAIKPLESVFEASNVPKIKEEKLCSFETISGDD